MAAHSAHKKPEPDIKPSSASVTETTETKTVNSEEGTPVQKTVIENVTLTQTSPDTTNVTKTLELKVTDAGKENVTKERR